jgi:hypothetical protein
MCWWDKVKVGQSAVKAICANPTLKKWRQFFQCTKTGFPIKVSPTPSSSSSCSSFLLDIHFQALL